MKRILIAIAILCLAIPAYAVTFGTEVVTVSAEIGETWAFSLDTNTADFGLLDKGLPAASITPIKIDTQAKCDAGNVYAVRILWPANLSNGSGGTLSTMATSDGVAGGWSHDTTRAGTCIDAVTNAILSGYIHISGTSATQAAGTYTGTYTFVAEH